MKPIAAMPTVNKIPPKKLQPSNLLPARSSGSTGVLAVVEVGVFAVVEDLEVVVVPFGVVVFFEVVVVLFVVDVLVSVVVEELEVVDEVVDDDELEDDAELEVGEVVEVDVVVSFTNSELDFGETSIGFGAAVGHLSMLTTISSRFLSSKSSSEHLVFWSS